MKSCRNRSLPGRPRGMFFVKGKNVMTTKTFDGQTARFLAAVATCMPSLQGDVMQGWIDNPKALKKALAGALCSPDVEKPKVYLQQLYVGEKIILDPTDGTRTIAQAGDVFAGGIDGNFKSWNLDVPAQATEAMEVGAHELILDGAFKSVYGSLRHSLDQLCLTPHQIVNFCVEHKGRLRQDDYPTFFLFNVGDKYFVASVNVCSDGRLRAHVYLFLLDDAWFAKYRPRFVIPQLEPSVA